MSKKYNRKTHEERARSLLPVLGRLPEGVAS